MHWCILLQQVLDCIIIYSTKVKHPNVEDNKKISPQLDHREIEGDLLGLKTTCNFIV